MNPHHLHPIFTEGTGSESTTSSISSPLSCFSSYTMFLRALSIYCWGSTTKPWKIWKESFAPFARNMWKKWRKPSLLTTVRVGRTWRLTKPRSTSGNIANVLEFQHLVKSTKGTIMWEQWGGGIIQRGRPTSLVLRRLTPKVTVLRAPGPGAIRRVEWKALANEFLCDRKVVLHTDSAKSYKLKVPGVLHDRVVHCKKRVKVQGKWRWQQPHYVRLVKPKLPGSKERH